PRRPDRNGMLLMAVPITTRCFSRENLPTFARCSSVRLSMLDQDLPQPRVRHDNSALDLRGRPAWRSPIPPTNAAADLSREQRRMEVDESRDRLLLAAMRAGEANSDPRAARKRR